MGQYIIEYTETAIKDLQKHKKAGNKATLNKIQKIVEELENHPTTGIGKPEALKHSLSGFWSREINKKDRLIYKILEKTIIVEVISAMGHYSDK
ncbi:MAG: Txe/YoeB family addiction module toxin [Bacteroidota bacterium]